MELEKNKQNKLWQIIIIIIQNRLPPEHTHKYSEYNRGDCRQSTLTSTVNIIEVTTVDKPLFICVFATVWVK